MKNPNYPAPDVALKETASVHRLIFKAIESSVVIAKTYFDKLDQEIDPWLAASMVRYHAGLYIDRRLPKIKGLHREPLPNSGLYLEFKRYRIRIRKSDEGEMPDPGPSQTMQAFYQQRLLGWDSVVGDDESIPVNLLVVWDATRSYVLLGMDLVCPKYGSEDKDSAEQHWKIAVPHPAATLPPVQPGPKDIPAAESDVDDLPYTRKRPPQTKTGTENTDG
jgi:hypothetical protein